MNPSISPASPSERPAKTSLRTDFSFFSNTYNDLKAAIQKPKPQVSAALSYDQLLKDLIKLIEDHDTESVTAVLCICSSIAGSNPTSVFMTFTVDETEFLEHMLESEVEGIIDHKQEYRTISAALMTLDHKLGTTRCIPVFRFTSYEIHQQESRSEKSSLFSPNSVDFRPFLHAESKLRS